MLEAGIAERTLRAACCWAAASARLYAWCRADVSERPNAASGGALRVTTTSVIAAAWAPSPSPANDAAASAVQVRRRAVLRMRMRGLEPPRPEGHTDLNRARLPIPPHPPGAKCSRGRYDRRRGD